MRKPAASRRHRPDRNWHPLPPVSDRNRHPLILRTRIPCREKKTRNPPRADRLVFQSLTRKDRQRSTDRHNRTDRCRSPSGRAGSGGTLRGCGISRAPGRRVSSPVPGCSRPGKPDLRNVVPEDLKDTGRLLDLYEQAVELGLVTDSEHDRLRFVAAAEHARIIGTRNPCGLFVRLVRGGSAAFRDV